MSTHEQIDFSCPTCHTQLQEKTALPSKNWRFCPYCGNSINLATNRPVDSFSAKYEILQVIGKGGMGEVFLAFDKQCERRIAIKRIRSDLLEHPQIRRRFLKEAYITCQLTHPAIIPIYAIASTNASVYYTMPFLEGQTLKQIIRHARQQEKNGILAGHLENSIPALVRIFMTVCQGVAYAHSKKILHRDLKPENIMIGKYGEVFILDWGLAKFLEHVQSENEEVLADDNIVDFQNQNITRLGKVVGTVAYMSPERALGNPATIQSEIYALGVILYQLLTLQSPFKRTTLSEFRQIWSKEKWIDPVLAAPYRDVPSILAKAVARCLTHVPEDRYQAVDELIKDVENYLEGRSDWFHIANLDIKNKNDWEFQEHVLMPGYTAITRGAEETEWVTLMISQQSFAGNVRIETSAYLKDKGMGIGILLSVPEIAERTSINDGYCLWLASDLNRSTRLFRSNVEVMHAYDVFLPRHQWVCIRVEKIERSIHLYLNDVLQFSYITHLPLMGTHIGFISRDDYFDLEPLSVAIGNLNLMVNCLAVPDAFLAHGDFSQALSEYRRIAYSFPDRTEGREALFRAGLTFIEQAKNETDKSFYLEMALDEFEKLHGSLSGPLEYLGKALVYQTLSEDVEEIKCFELAYRRYPRHPLLSILQEQILSRTHALSRYQRISTYRFVLLIACYFPFSAIDAHTQRLCASLEKHWEVLPFIIEEERQNGPQQITRLIIPLSFWLVKPHSLGEVIDAFIQNGKSSTSTSALAIGNACACLLELGAYKFAQAKLNMVIDQLVIDSPSMTANLAKMLALHSDGLENGFDNLFNDTFTSIDSFQKRTLLYFMDLALDAYRPDLVEEAWPYLAPCISSLNHHQVAFNVRRIWALLLQKKWSEARDLFYEYPIEFLNKGNTLIHFLYGCWLKATEGQEIAHVHFTGLLHVTYPRSWTLASHVLSGDIALQGGWMDKALLWEKRQLFRQLTLYYHCAEELSQQKHYAQLYMQQFIDVAI